MDQDSGERRRTRTLLGATAVAGALLLAAVTPSPYVVEQPGPVVDTLGEAEDDGKSVPVISIEGAETYPTSGSLNLLTVSILGNREQPRSWLALVPALLDPTQRIAPVDEFFPEGVTVEERDTENAVLMDSSQMQAAAAAFRALGQEVRTVLTVAGVAESGPAAGELEAGDRIVSLNGRKLADFTELRRGVAASEDRAAVRLGIERDGEPQELELTPRAPREGEEPMLGITVAARYELPAEVDFSLTRIGGPSAGLVFALAVLDRLTPGELLEGHTVSGTGTITDAGEVGAIGGLAQKMWAADRAGSELFLMPLANCADLPDRRPPGLRIAPVATLDEAVQAIEAVNAGEEPRGVERCAAAS
ncbi:YlbL family protein [Leucobacter massiliensis]|uniref:ATP-dependent serine protease n=1 Tax=Leucobacter massiliensis TaxID=1686285 RepID=A0A2S9QMQ0_9MICO|nr:S16 family serine protease [Leucobacter massiliensis]PRI10874.1 ATP-dependent serine protease [Leucobacter massiliensis]